MANLIDNNEFERLKRDLSRRFIKHRGKSVYWKIKFYWKFPQYRTLFYYRLTKTFKVRLFRGLSRRLYSRNSRKFGLEIHTPKLGGGIIMPHWGRILINAQEVGDDLYIFHNVTIGNDYKTGVPIIGSNVFIGTASTILGDITIGDNVVIGAGSCVTTDIPSNSLVAGNPAKIIRSLAPDYMKQRIGW